MTKGELKDWAEAVRKAVHDDPDFKSLKNEQEMPAEARVFKEIIRLAEDTRFREFARHAGVLAEAEAPTVLAVPGEAKPEPIGFGEFMRGLSESVVSTQERLDSESARYLAKIKDKKHVHPAVFRLPKVSAEMRFALEVDRQKGLNFLFFSDKEKNVSRNEQGIQFDIVTVPAPPDALQAMAALAPRLSLVLDPFERQALIAIIAAATPDTKLNPLIEGARREPSRLVILETTPKDPPEYLVFFATTESDHSVGLWWVQRSVGSQPRVIYRFAKSNGPEESEIHKFILNLSDEQEKYLQ